MTVLSGGAAVKPINHGTPAGYQAHWRRGEKACDPCRAAFAAARTARRRADPEHRAEVYLRNAARSRALWRLRAEYPERYRQLFIEEVTR